MKRIRLANKYNSDVYAIVDDDIYDYASRFKWYLDTHGYAVSSIPQAHNIYGVRNVKLHRLVMFKELEGTDMIIDHINNDPLDNRRSNLRVCRQKENMRNTRKRKDCSSKFKGVCFDKSRNKWMAYLNLNGRRYNLGRFDDEDEAALAYNNAASFYFGEYANLNVIGACKQ